MRTVPGMALVLWLVAASLAGAQAPTGTPPVTPPGSPYAGTIPDAAAWSRPPAAALEPGTGPYPQAGFDPDQIVEMPAGDTGAAAMGTVVYGSAEYLLWYPRRASLPQLLVTYPTSAVGQDGTVDQQFLGNVLAGADEGTPSGGMSGVRAFAGAYLDAAADYAVEAGYFVLPEISKGFSLGSNGTPLLARAYNDITQANTALFVRLASPGDLAGGFNYTTDIFMQGFEGNFRIRGPQVLADRFDMIAGFRYIDLDESIRINDTSLALSQRGANSLAPALPMPAANMVPGTNVVGPGARLSTFDRFKTRNQFYGAQIGGQARFSSFSNRFTLDVIGKFAFGGLNQTVEIDGSSVLRLADGTTFRSGGGSLTAASNIGKYSDTKWIIVPELTVNAGYRITSNVLAFVGYNALYMSQTQRPSLAINSSVNPSNLPFRGANFPSSPLALPNFTFSQTEAFWVQGLNAGLQFTY